MDYRILVADGTEISAADMRGKPCDATVAFAVRGTNFIELNNGEILYFFGMKFGSQADEAEGCAAMMRSYDGGKTFGETVILKYDGSPTGGGTPIYDPKTNTLILLARTRHWKPGFEEDRLIAEMDQLKGHTYERFFVIKSTDGGRTWGEYKEVFVDGTPEDWTVEHCCTPGVGLVLSHQKDEKKNGRLVMPCNHAKLVDGKNNFLAHLIYSDDMGDTWKVGGIQNYFGANESVAVEMDDGTIVFNCRNQGGSPANRRIQAYSTDGAETLLPGSGTVELFDAICHAGFAKVYSDGKEYILYTIPSGDVQKVCMSFGAPTSYGNREALRLFASDDGGKTYRDLGLLSDKGKFAAYSSICPLCNGTVLIGWETGPQINLYRDLVYNIYSVSELLK